MKEIQVVTQYSPWFVFLCILIGAGYAYFLYQKPSVWGKNINRFLTGIRFLLVTLVSILLIGIFLNSVKKYYEKPIYALLIDNSQSITFLQDSSFQQKIIKSLQTVSAKLTENGYQVDYYDLNQKQGNIQDLQFQANATNIGKSLSQIQSDYENQNLAGVVLLSDGICNQGILPTYQSYPFPIHTIGVGDTTIHQDLQIRKLTYNKVSYLNNQFSIIAEIDNKGYQGQNTKVLLKQNDTILSEQVVNFYQQEGVQKIQFLTTAKKIGKIRYQVELKSLENELTTTNNIRNAYIDVVQQKEKILLLANAPHPDIKMFRSVIQKQEKYELDVVILANTPQYKWVRKSPYSLVIFHQLPHVKQKHQKLVEEITKSDVSLLYVIGKETKIATFNDQNKLLTIKQQLVQHDEVHGVWNSTFEKFEFDVEKWAPFIEAPPLEVPFAEYNLKNNTEVLLFQQLGSASTKKPMVLFGEQNNRKIGVMIGEGFWKWRMFEQLYSNKIEVFDDFIKKYFQLLTVKKDKRKFVVQPKADEIFESENISFSIHCYNDIYEEIFNQDITLKIYDEENKMSEFHFTTNNVNDNYQLNQLKEGVYRYVATTKIDGKIQTKSGSFLIKAMRLEELNLVADFDLLAKIAQNTQGNFSLFQENNKNLLKTLLKKKPQEVIHSTEQELEIIHFKWICYLLILLVSIEWGTRKFMGGY